MTKILTIATAITITTRAKTTIKTTTLIAAITKHQQKKTKTGHRIWVLAEPDQGTF